MIDVECKVTLYNENNKAESIYLYIRNHPKDSQMVEFTIGDESYFVKKLDLIQAAKNCGETAMF